jgi:hypothetical protein
VPRSAAQQVYSRRVNQMDGVEHARIFSCECDLIMYILNF